MRCRKDDLAFTVAPIAKSPSNADKLVRCIRIWGGEDLDDIRFTNSNGLRSAENPYWVVESLGAPFINLRDHKQTTMSVPWPDRLLRPLRGDPEVIKNGEPEEAKKSNL